MSERNKAIMRRGIEEVWSQGNYEVIDELVASDFVAHMPSNDNHGPEGVKQYFGMLRSAFPDIHFTIEDQFAESDRVVSRWTARATHKGEYMGVPPTGRSGLVTGITISRFADGKIVEGWTQLDALGLMQQIGAIPTPEPAV